MMNSAFLIILDKKKIKSNLDPVCTGSLTEAKNLLKKSHSFTVLASYINQEKYKEVLKFNEYVEKNHPKIQKILILENLEGPLINEAINRIHFKGLVNIKNLDQIDSILIKAFEAYKTKKQNEEFVFLMKNSYQSTKKQSELLELSIQKKTLLKQKEEEKLSNIKNIKKILTEVIDSCYGCLSFKATENRILKVLEKYTSIKNIKISHIDQKEEISQTLILNKEHALGYFYKTKEEVFGKIEFITGQKDYTAFEKEVILRLTETLSPFIFRIKRIQEIKKNDSQWTTTFNSILSPLCLVNDHLEIIESNTSFKKNFLQKNEEQKNLKDILKLKENSEILNQLKSNPDKNLREKINYQKKQFLICIEKIKIKEEKNHLISFKDITESEKIERSILQSSKIAEMGVITSSLAHELNNPLSSLKSHIYFIKQYMRKENNLYYENLKTIGLMEKQAYECKYAIENLLKIVRPICDRTDEKMNLDLEIQSFIKKYKKEFKSSILIEYKNQLDEKTDHVLNGNKKFFFEALKGIVRNSEESIRDKSHKDIIPFGKVSIELKLKDDLYMISVEDKGIGMDKKTLKKSMNPLFTTKDKKLHSGLGLSYSFKIISELGGQLEINSWKNQGTLVVIYLKKPEKIMSKVQVISENLT